jgi:hypothetical protein
MENSFVKPSLNIPNILGSIFARFLGKISA